MPQDVLHPDLTRRARSYLVLRLTLGYADYYLSSDTFTISDGGREIQVWDAITDVSWSESLDLFSASPQTISIPFEVHIPGVSIPDLIRRGTDISAGRGELSRWVEGTSWSQRQVLVVGDLIEPVYGAADEPWSFSLSSGPFEDRSSTIDPDMIIDGTSWPSADQAAYGNTYPTVVGTPGWRGVAGEPLIAGTPGYIVRVQQATAWVLLAGHEVASEEVWVRNVDKDLGWTPRPVVLVRDGRNRTVSVAEIPNHTTILDPDPCTYSTAEATSTVGDTYLVSWGPPSSPGLTRMGGMWDYRRSAALSGAGDVLLEFLRRSTLRVDVGRTAAAAVQLNAYRLSGYFDEDTSNWEWLRANIIPLLPVSIVAGPDGLFPVVWPVDATPRDAATHLDVDGGAAERSSPVTYSALADAANEVRVAYALDIERDLHTRQIRATGDDNWAEAEFDEVLLPIDVLRASRSRYGLAARTTETDWVYDSATAGKVTYWQAYAHGVCTRSVSYVVPRELRWLDLGTLLTVTDSEIAWLDQLCWVEGISDAADDQIEVTLRTIENPTAPKR